METRYSDPIVEKHSIMFAVCFPHFQIASRQSGTIVRHTLSDLQVNTVLNTSYIFQDTTFRKVSNVEMTSQLRNECIEDRLEIRCVV